MSSGSANVQWIIRTAMVFVVAATVLAWVAVGESADGSSRSAALGDQLKLSADALVVGSASTAEAMTNTITISQNLRALLDRLKTSGDIARIKSSLAETEAALLENQGGVDETRSALVAAQPKIDAAVAALHDGDDAHDVALWRVAIVLAALAMLSLFYVLTPPVSAPTSDFYVSADAEAE